MCKQISFPGNIKKVICTSSYNRPAPSYIEGCRVMTFDTTSFVFFFTLFKYYYYILKNSKLHKYIALTQWYV